MEEAGTLSYQYDKIYKWLDALVKKYNPCEFKDGVCIAGRKDGCCRSTTDPKVVCPDLTPKGCSVKSITCRGFICCDAVDSNHNALEFSIAVYKLPRYRNEFDKRNCPDGYAFGAGKEYHLREAEKRGKL